MIGQNKTIWPMPCRAVAIGQRVQPGRSRYIVFFLCVLFVLSISPLYTAAWVTFNGVGRLQPGLFRASHLILWNASCYFCVLPRRLSRLSSFSLSFSVHILRIESLFLCCLKSFGSSPFQTRARLRVYVVIHRRALVCFVFKFHFQFHFAFRSECDGEFQ